VVFSRSAVVTALRREPAGGQDVSRRVRHQLVWFNCNDCGRLFIIPRPFNKCPVLAANVLIRRSL
jgi:hypothetical protein